MALTNYYVDPAINANSGTGTSGDPYGDLQYALNTITRDATNGDQINVKAGTAEVLAAVLSIATYGTPTVTAPLRIRGYTSTANDGGQAEINCNGNAGFPSAVWFLRDLYIRNGGANTLITMGGGSVIDCKIADATGTGILSSNNTVSNCEFTDLATAINVSNSAYIYGNYFKAGGIRDFTQALNVSATSPAHIERNIFSMGTTGNAIYQTGAKNRIINNSIFAAASTGTGIGTNSQAHYAGAVVMNNVIEGFSGSGGKGINFATTTNHPARYAGNAFYNNATNISNVGVADDIEDTDNEVLGATPFAKSGSDTFANRFVYFAPVDTGNVHGGAIQ